ncbi:hypothetical protein PIB30_075262 [Stylosanthes scabra]|uniref:Uncharacterized protein n=1 Tax=Stylosanthes scabra TaxID=79078 RepID=A0ABU6QQG7_9FABA|nr:hypothetical protein [Stylosanthes scabra]
MSSLGGNVAGKESDTMDGTQNHSQSGNIGAKENQMQLLSKNFFGSVYRIKYHLAWTKRDVSACENVSPEVRKQMWDIVVGLQANLMRETISAEERATKDDDDNDEDMEEKPNPSVGEKRKGREPETPSTLFKKKTTQATINSIF